MSDAWQADILWEECRSCGREYAYPHLCRTHMLCGVCHPTGGMAPPRQRPDTNERE